MYGFVTPVWNGQPRKLPANAGFTHRPAFGMRIAQMLIMLTLLSLDQPGQAAPLRQEAVPASERRARMAGAAHRTDRLAVERWFFDVIETSGATGHLREGLRGARAKAHIRAVGVATYQVTAPFYTRFDRLTFRRLTARIALT